MTVQKAILFPFQNAKNFSDKIWLAKSVVVSSDAIKAGAACVHWIPMPYCALSLLTLPKRGRHSLVARGVVFREGETRGGMLQVSFLCLA